MSNIDLLPRADIPVLFNDFKCKADAVWAVVDSLVVTNITQKEEMALARKTRLTLREIRIAVEHKRVELGESHLKEIQKVNGAAKSIREFLEPLEARLLMQETYAERAEADRIVALSKLRFDEIRAVSTLSARFGPTSDLGTMPQEEYDVYIARLRAEVAEMAEAKRRQAEAEAKLATEQAEAKRVAEVTRAELELIQRVALEVKQKSDAEALRVEQAIRAEATELMRQQQVETERQRKETAAILNAKLEAQRKESEALATKQAAEYKREREEYELKARVVREEKAVLERQIAATALDIARAAAVEEKRLRDLACAPDVEKLRAFSAFLLSIKGPGDLTTPEAIAVLGSSAAKFAEAVFIIDVFCGQESLTTK